MKITGTFAVNLRNKYVQQLGRQAAADAMLDLGSDVQTQAKINVSPGMGPGPHPHVSEHEDLGKLRESVEVDVTQSGDKVSATVGTSVDYGAYLEIGWVAKSGKFYRYPWIFPALQAVVPPWQIRAGAKMRRTLETGSGTTRIK